MKLFVLIYLNNLIILINSLNDNNYERLKYNQIISLDITTSSSSFSETINNISATFIGDFSISGPHSIGNFLEPSLTINKVIKYDRVIGILKEIQLYNSGTDGWLLSDIRGYTNDYIYEFKWNRQWLDSIDPLLLEMYGNGYEPFCQETLEQLPAKSTLLLEVVNIVPIISRSGVYRPDLASLVEN